MSTDLGSEHNCELKKCKKKLISGEPCGEYFVSNYKLKRHQEESSAHCAEKPFKCRICNKGFSRKDTKNRHERNESCKQVSCFSKRALI